MFCHEIVVYQVYEISFSDGESIFAFGQRRPPPRTDPNPEQRPAWLVCCDARSPFSERLISLTGRSRRDASNAGRFGTDTIPTMEISRMEIWPRGGNDLHRRILLSFWDIFTR